MLSGARIPAKKALELGIVDKVVNDDSRLIDEAIQLCRERRGDAKLRSIAALPPPEPDCDFEAIRKQMTLKRPGKY